MIYTKYLCNTEERKDS